MKKSSYILFAVLAFSSCSNDETLNEQVNVNNEKTYTIDINKRSYNEIVEIAQNSISILQDSTSITRGNNTARTLNLKNGIKAICQPSTRANGGNDTLLYIVNFNDKKGFAVVSANRFTDGLIAVVESGEYDPNTPSGNPALDICMESAAKYVASVEGKPEVKTRASSYYYMYKPQYDTLYYNKVEPKVKVKWGQNGYMSQYCPNYYPCGCCNTAAAQIMSYFGWHYGFPKEMDLTYPGRNTNKISFMWDKIGLVAKTNDIYNLNYDQKACLQIGQLARQLGYLSQTTYNQSGSMTTDSKIRAALLKFKFKVGDLKNYKPYLTENGVVNSNAGLPLAGALSEGKLIYMAGSSTDGEGHAWVVDGCYYVRAEQNFMGSNDGIHWYVDRKVASYETSYNHINWGCDGYGDGYFNSWIFNANNAVSYDYSKGTNKSYYKNMKYFTVDIENKVLIRK